MRIDRNDTITAITTRYPDSIALLAYYGIDSCGGGGDKTLEEAARRHDVELDDLMQRLETATAYAASGSA